MLFNLYQLRISEVRSKCATVLDGLFHSTAEYRDCRNCAIYIIPDSDTQGVGDSRSTLPLNRHISVPHTGGLWVQPRAPSEERGLVPFWHGVIDQGLISCLIEPMYCALQHRP